jgi:hypothetical protein
MGHVGCCSRVLGDSLMKVEEKEKHHDGQVVERKAHAVQAHLFVVDVVSHSTAYQESSDYVDRDKQKYARDKLQGSD